MRVTGLLRVGIAATTLFASACSGTAQPATSPAVSVSPVASPSRTPSASPTPTASPSPVASPSPSCPTASAGQQVICPTTGEAQAKLTGAIMLSFNGAIMTPPVYRPLITLPAGPVTLAYRSGSDEIFLQLVTAGLGTIKTDGVVLQLQRWWRRLRLFARRVHYRRQAGVGDLVLRLVLLQRHPAEARAWTN